MASTNFFTFTTLFSCYIWIASALTSDYFFSANFPTNWTNNDTSLPEAVHFVDGSMARLMLVREVPSLDTTPRNFGFAFCFHCNLSAADSCHLSVLLVEMFNGTILKGSPRAVWSANRDSPIGENATLVFSHNGALTLLDANGAIVWNSNTWGTPISRMSIYEEGNLVLLSQANTTVWRSFDHPTDTIVVGQTIWWGQRLTSSISSVNMSHGLFYLCIDGDGLSGFVEGDRPTRYQHFSPSPFPVLDTLQYIEFKSGELTFFYESSGSRKTIPIQIPRSATMQFLRLDVDGGLRIYGWEQASGWKTIHVLLDIWYDECQFPLKCGRYGVCQSMQCSCPVGIDGTKYFEPVNSEFPNLGCRQITPSPLKDQYNQYQLVYFGHLSYFSYDDEDAAVSGIESEETCKQACIEEASCKAAFFKYDNFTSKGYCYLPSEVLSIIGSLLPSFHFSSCHIKVQTLFSEQAASFQFKKLVAGASALVALVLAVVCLLLIKKKCYQEDQDYLKKLSETLRSFSYRELLIATRKFSEKLGGGGFGMVFKGVLKDGTVVAVKRLENIGQGVREFVAEVETIGNLHHINLVRLIGFCVEKRYRMLVYEYMSNGSLDKWIFNERTSISLDLKTRKKILLHIARGLAYLHEECRQRIAHLDVKPHNILLDDDFNAKLSDFGMSKLINRDESQVLTGIRGTLGYLAPEWQDARITVKADTYSFGIVLLEVISGRKILDYSRPDSDVHLLNLLQKKAVENKLLDIIDSQSEHMQCHVPEALHMIKLGIWCLNADYKSRPPMSLVVKILEGEMEFQPEISYNFSSVMTATLCPSIPSSFSSHASVNLNTAVNFYRSFV